MAEKREIKRWNVYHNLWAGYDAYFIAERTDSLYASGYLFHNAKRKWEVRRARFYCQDLEYDATHFMIVGKINLYALVVNALVDLLVDKCDNDAEQSH